MNYYQLIFKPDFRVKEFYEGQTYIFKSELELEKGDYVVAMTKFGYSIAVVYEKNDVKASYNTYSENVAKIVTKLEGNYFKEKEMAEELKAIEKILNQKTKEMSKIMQYEAIAKYDPNAQELLEKYKQIKSCNTVLSLTELSTKRNEEDEEDEEDYLPF